MVDGGNFAELKNILQMFRADEDTQEMNEKFEKEKQNQYNKVQKNKIAMEKNKQFAKGRKNRKNRDDDDEEEEGEQETTETMEKRLAQTRKQYQEQMLAKKRELEAQSGPTVANPEFIKVKEERERERERHERHEKEEMIIVNTLSKNMLIFVFPVVSDPLFSEYNKTNKNTQT